MKTLLSALEEGRLIELPENNKDKALQILGSLIEAIPGLKAGTQVVESVLARERAANTALGMGWACPHARTAAEGELLCAVGWSPTGIDYGAPDNLPVRLVVMYYIPDAQKNAYLKEISALARVIGKAGGLPQIEQAKDLNEVRIRLLDVISAALETDTPEARARMVRIEAKQAAVAAVPTAPIAGVAWPAQIMPLSVLMVPGKSPLILAQDRELVMALETAADLPTQLARQSQADAVGYRVLTRHTIAYAPDRVLYECLALKLTNGAPKPA
ncbi:MAG: PTS sugar transporter subunit IIA [Verrucomicrobia bacterium]|nr:MAG: PTS sugar transporter subunit IIA [Verrucomicrobiota bacterium]